MAKLRSSSAEKSRGKLEILRDIYGERKGTVYEYGLAESENEGEFLLKLRSLERKWESLCPGFFKWFCDHRISKFVDSVICTARDETEVTGLYYQNDIESMHFVEKKNQEFKKKSVQDVINGIKKLISQQETDEIRALYGAGNYELSIAYKNFLVDSSTWHSWSEQPRENHIKAFLNFKPGLSDTLENAKIS